MFMQLLSLGLIDQKLLQIDWNLWNFQKSIGSNINLKTLVVE